MRYEAEDMAMTTFLVWLYGTRSRPFSIWKQARQCKLIVHCGQSIGEAVMCLSRGSVCPSSSSAFILFPFHIPINRAMISLIKMGTFLVTYYCPNFGHTLHTINANMQQKGHVLFTEAAQSTGTASATKCIYFEAFITFCQCLC